MSPRYPFLRNWDPDIGLYIDLRTKRRPAIHLSHKNKAFYGVTMCGRSIMPAEPTMAMVRDSPRCANCLKAYEKFVLDRAVGITP